MMHLTKQWLFIGTAVLLIVLGIALGLVLLANLPFGGDLLRTLLLGALLVTIYVLCLLLFMRPAPSRTKGRRSSQRQHQRTLPRGKRPVRLAKLQFKLDDPHDSHSFQVFLVQPLLDTGERHTSGGYQTPLQAIESALIRYARELERSHRGRLAVDIRMKQSSLTVALTIFTAYEFLSQYHDFIESIQLIQKQLQGLAQEAGRWYYQATGRKLKVEADAVINARAQAPVIARRPRAATYASRVEKAAPSSAYNEVRINIYGFSFLALLLNYLAVLLAFMLLAALVAVMGCSILDAQDSCARWGQEITAWLAQFFNLNLILSEHSGPGY